jgi:hypothetical protein
LLARNFVIHCGLRRKMELELRKKMQSSWRFLEIEGQWKAVCRWTMELELMQKINTHFALQECETSKDFYFNCVFFPDRQSAENHVFEVFSQESYGSITK